MLNNTASSIAQFFYTNKVIQDEDDIEIYAYGLEILLATILEISAVILLSIIIKQFYSTIAFLAVFMPLRTYAGGYHAKTHFRCFLVLLAVYGIFIAMIFSIKDMMIPEYLIIAAMISFVTVYVFSPVEDANKPLSSKEKKKYRKISIVIVTIQSILIIVLSVFKTSSITVFSLTVGQLAASLSLVIAKILKKGAS